MKKNCNEYVLRHLLDNNSQVWAAAKPQAHTQLGYSITQGVHKHKKRNKYKALQRVHQNAQKEQRW